MRSNAARWIVIGLVAAATLLLAFRLRAVLSPFLTGLVIAYLLAPAAAFFQRRGLSRGLAVAAVYATVIVVFSLVAVWVMPRVFAELARLAENLPAYTEQIQGLIAQAQARYEFVPPSVRQVIEQTAADLGAGLMTAVKTAIQGSAGFVSGLANFVFAWIVSVYFLLDWRKIGQRCLALLPLASRPVAEQLAADLDDLLGGYLRGMAMLAVITGVASGFIVLIAGLRFALLFGILSAVGEFIPYFGPLAAAAAPVIMAWLRSPALALKVAIAYIMVQQIQSNVISPKVVGDRLGLHPLAILFALLAGQSLFGVPGMLLAAPVAGMLGILIRYASRWLPGSRPATGGGSPPEAPGAAPQKD